MVPPLTHALRHLETLLLPAIARRFSAYFSVAIMGAAAPLLGGAPDQRATGAGLFRFHRGRTISIFCVAAERAAVFVNIAIEGRTQTTLCGDAWRLLNLKNRGCA